MDSSIIYFLAMLSRVLYLSNNNLPILLLIPAFNGFITQLNARKLVCDGLVQKLQAKTLANTTLCVDLKKEVALFFSSCCATASSYGYTVKDAVLMDLAKYQEYDLFQMKNEELKDLLATILKAVDDNKTALIPFGITPQFILTLIDLQTQFIAFNLSKNLIDLHKDTKIALETEVKSLRVFLKRNLDSTARMFIFNHNVEFFNAYKSARKVPSHHMHAKTPIIPGATTGDLLVNISNQLTGESEQGVTCSILAINFIAVSDINGQIAKDQLLPAEYSAILTKENRTPIQFTFIIKAGQTNEIGFLMETIIPQA